MDALWQRSRMTWTEITVAPHKGLELEKIPQSALKKAIPASVTPDVNFIALRFGDAARIVGYRDRSILHIIWVDRAHEVYGG